MGSEGGKRAILHDSYCMMLHRAAFIHVFPGF